jgi:hypothetical protein
MERPSGGAVFALAVLLACGVMFVEPAWGAHELTPKQKEVLDFWLQHHKGYRLANDADCDCAADIREMRLGSSGVWKPAPGYHPYVVSGDFNGDGETDFAVVVVKRSKREHTFSLLVFNGPFESSDVAPAFLDTDLDLKGSGLFYGPPRPKPYRLVVGRFEAEGEILIPHGRKYRYESFNP